MFFGYLCIIPKYVARHWDASPIQIHLLLPSHACAIPSHLTLGDLVSVLVSLSYSHSSRLINNPKPPSSDDKLPQEIDREGRGVGCTPMQDLCWLQKLPDKACAGGRNLLMSFQARDFSPAFPSEDPRAPGSAHKPLQLMLVGAPAPTHSKQNRTRRLVGFEGMFERGTGRGCSSGKQGVGFTLGIDKCSAGSAAPVAPTNAVPVLGGLLLPARPWQGVSHG